VVWPNSGTILGYGWYAIVIAAAALCLNLTGYLVGWTARLFTNDREEMIAILFTVSNKELNIAAAFVVASRLPSGLAMPPVIQTITSPIAAKILAQGANQALVRPGEPSA